jgi:AraC family transcriptional regulator
MKIDIVERQPVRVAYLRYTGPAGESLGRFWRNTVAPWLADHGLVDCPRYGVIADSRYDAGIELPPGMTLPDVAETTIAGGRYAVTYFKGSGADIAAAWSAFTAQFLADSRNRVDSSRPSLEHMPRGGFYDARTGVFTCQLCLPVVV